MLGVNDDRLRAFRGSLTGDDVERIHEASLQVLSDVGLRMTDPEAKALFQQAGAKIDEAAGVVKLPPDLVEWGLQQARGELTRYAMDGEPYVFRAGEMYHCTGTHRTKVLDFGADFLRD